MATLVKEMQYFIKQHAKQKVAHINKKDEKKIEDLANKYSKKEIINTFYDKLLELVMAETQKVKFKTTNDIVSEKKINEIARRYANAISAFAHILVNITNEMPKPTDEINGKLIVELYDHGKTISNLIQASPDIFQNDHVFKAIGEKTKRNHHDGDFAQDVFCFNSPDRIAITYNTRTYATVGRLITDKSNTHPIDKDIGKVCTLEFDSNPHNSGYKADESKDPNIYKPIIDNFIETSKKSTAKSIKIAIDVHGSKNGTVNMSSESIQYLLEKINNDEILKNKNIEIVQYSCYSAKKTKDNKNLLDIFKSFAGKQNGKVTYTSHINDKTKQATHIRQLIDDKDTYNHFGHNIFEYQVFDKNTQNFVLIGPQDQQADYLAKKKIVDNNLISESPYEIYQLASKHDLYSMFAYLRQAKQMKNQIIFGKAIEVAPPNPAPAPNPLINPNPAPAPGPGPAPAPAPNPVAPTDPLQKLKSVFNNKGDAYVNNLVDKIYSKKTKLEQWLKNTENWVKTLKQHNPNCCSNPNYIDFQKISDKNIKDNTVLIIPGHGGYHLDGGYFMNSAKAMYDDPSQPNGELLPNEKQEINQGKAAVHKYGNGRYGIYTVGPRYNIDGLDSFKNKLSKLLASVGDVIKTEINNNNPGFVNKQIYFGGISNGDYAAGMNEIYSPNYLNVALALEALFSGDDDTNLNIAVKQIVLSPVIYTNLLEIMSAVEAYKTKQPQVWPPVKDPNNPINIVPDDNLKPKPAINPINNGNAGQVMPDPVVPNPAPAPNPPINPNPVPVPGPGPAPAPAPTPNPSPNQASDPNNNSQNKQTEKQQDNAQKITILKPIEKSSNNSQPRPNTTDMLRRVDIQIHQINDNSSDKTKDDTIVFESLILDNHDIDIENTVKNINDPAVNEKIINKIKEQNVDTLNQVDSSIKLPQKISKPKNEWWMYVLRLFLIGFVITYIQKKRRKAFEKKHQNILNAASRTSLSVSDLSYSINGK